MGNGGRMRMAYICIIGIKGYDAYKQKQVIVKKSLILTQNIIRF